MADRREKVSSEQFYFLGLQNGEGNGTPLQHSCLENPMDGGAWWATVHGVAKSQTGLSDFTFTFHFHALEKEMATSGCRFPSLPRFPLLFTLLFLAFRCSSLFSSQALCFLASLSFGTVLLVAFCTLLQSSARRPSTTLVTRSSPLSPLVSSSAKSYGI